MARFVVLRNEAQYLILDTKLPSEPVVVCHMSGWKAPLQADYVCAALEHYHVSLLEKLYVIPHTGDDAGGYYDEHPDGELRDDAGDDSAEGARDGQPHSGARKL
jgi:hypothetical protein